MGGQRRSKSSDCGPNVETFRRKAKSARTHSGSPMQSQKGPRSIGKPRGEIGSGTCIASLGEAGARRVLERKSSFVMLYIPCAPVFRIGPCGHHMIPGPRVPRRNRARSASSRHAGSRHVRPNARFEIPPSWPLSVHCSGEFRRRPMPQTLDRQCAKSLPRRWICYLLISFRKRRFLAPLSPDSGVPREEMANGVRLGYVLRGLLYISGRAPVGEGLGVFDLLPLRNAHRRGVNSGDQLVLPGLSQATLVLQPGLIPTSITFPPPSNQTPPSPVMADSDASQRAMRVAPMFVEDGARRAILAPQAPVAGVAVIRWRVLPWVGCVHRVCPGAANAERV